MANSVSFWHFRLLSTGTIEEKICQHQAQNRALSSCVAHYEERHFSLAQLEELFRLEAETISDTHDTPLNCKSCNLNKVQIEESPAEADCNGHLKDWYHAADKKYLVDGLLIRARDKGVTHVMHQKAHFATPIP